MLYVIYHCCVYSEKLLMTDRGNVRHTQSSISNKLYDTLQRLIQDPALQLALMNYLRKLSKITWRRWWMSLYGSLAEWHRQGRKEVFGWKPLPAPLCTPPRWTWNGLELNGDFHGLANDHLSPPSSASAGMKRCDEDDYRNKAVLSNEIRVCAA